MNQASPELQAARARRNPINGNSPTYADARLILDDIESAKVIEMNWVICYRPKFKDYLCFPHVIGSLPKSYRIVTSEQN